MAFLTTPGTRALCALAAFLLFAALAACEQPSRPGLERVALGGKTFWVEPVLHEEARIKGLGGRDSIPEDGGMLFVFPSAQPMYFVMRDCKFDIDIAFLDDAGRIVAMHTMKVEPKNEGESDIEYEERLTKYPSRYVARMAIEVRPGTLEKLGVKPGDKVELDTEGLKKRAT